MQKFLLSVISVLVYTGVNATDFSGTYDCHLSDHTDGPFSARLILKKDESASFDDVGYGSYLINFHVMGIPYDYSGFAAQRGNELALYFESTGSNKNPDDRGVGIASVILDQDKNGKKVISFHKFYYEKSYKGKSNYGFEDCMKVQ